MKKTTFIVMIVTIIAKIFGFLRDITITGLFSVGAVSDAFTFAYSLPSMVFSVITATLVTGFVPMYSRVLKDSKNKANTFANNVFNILNLVAFVVGILFILIPELLVTVGAPQFASKPETFANAVLLVRLMSFSIIGMSIAQLGTGYLNVHQSFILPNLISIPGNMIIVVGAFLTQRANNIWYLGVAALLSYLVQGLIIFIQMRRVGFKYKPTLDFKDEHLHRMIVLSVPLLLSALISTGNDMFTRGYASTLAGEGAYTYITYAGRLQSFATGLFVTGVLSVAYPTITRAVVEKDRHNLIHSINDAILMIALFILPAMVGMFMLSEEIVKFVYMRANFSQENAETLAVIFLGYAAGILFVGLRDLFMRIHYAHQDMRRPLIGSIIYIVVNIIGCIVLGQVFQFGLVGLSVATTLAALASAGYLIWSTKHNLNILVLKPIVSDFIKISAATVLMGLTIWIVNPIFQRFLSNRFALLFTIAIAGVVYIGAILFFKVRIIWSVLKSRKKA